MKQVKIAKQILNILLVASPKDLFLVHFCFYYMLATCQMHLSYKNQLCLPMMLIFSLILRTLNLFTVVKNKLVNIKDWFTANKLSLNEEKTKYAFFHKPSKKDDIPLRLPKLIINNYEIQREESIKFLGVLLDQQRRRIYQVPWGFIIPTFNMERTHKTY